MAEAIGCGRSSALERKETRADVQITRPVPAGRGSPDNPIPPFLRTRFFCNFCPHNGLHPYTDRNLSPYGDEHMRQKRLWVLFSLILVTALRSRADVALLLEEPYGDFGGFNPTGHAALYLSGVCAATPLILRKCFPGENGVVISRYYKIAGYDWIAIPLTAYLYAVDDPAQIPEFADARRVNELRDNYRRRYLEALAPDRPNGDAPSGEWSLLVGEAYDRKIYGFQIATTEQQDDELIQMLNQRPNKRSKHNLATFLVSRNCADFARGVLNFYHPHSVHRNFIADLGITT